MNCDVCKKEINGNHYTLKFTEIDEDTHETLVAYVFFHRRCSYVSAQTEIALKMLESGYVNANQEKA